MRLIILGYKVADISIAKEIHTKRLRSLGIYSIPDKLKRFFSKVHTHSAIHLGFYDAAKRLEITSYWVESLSEINFKFNSDDVVLTEATYLRHIPNNYNFKLIIHGICSAEWPEHILNGKYYTFSNYHASDIEKYKKMEKIGNFIYFSQEKRHIVTAWASDFYGENNFVSDKSRSQERNCYYIGNFSDDAFIVAKDIKRALQKKNINLTRVSGLNQKRMYEISIQSNFLFDVRCKHHLEVGYIPCRVFKSLSYGRNIFINSEKLINQFKSANLQFFQDGDQLNDLLEKSLLGYFDESSKALMEEVRGEHLYTCRLQQILSLI